MFNLQQFCVDNAQVLELLDYCNGCWASKGFNFDEFVFWLVKAQPYYDKDKGLKLYDDIKIKWCFVHDLEYALKNFKILADFRLAKFLFLKLHHFSLWLRILVFLWVFFWLLIYWNKAYKNAEKKTIQEIIEEVENYKCIYFSR